MAMVDTAGAEIPLSRGSDEYKAALEIELWKEIAQQEFFTNLRKREEKVLSEFSTVFKEEQARLESEVRSCKRTSDDLIKQYKNKLASLEKREKKYNQNEAAFERAYSTFSQERTTKLDDVKQKSNYRSDFLNIELETVISKIKSAEHLNARLVHRIEEAEKATSLKETELSNTAQPNVSQIPVELQDELFNAKTQFASSKDRLSKITIAKERYKMKLKSVLEELSKSKQASNQAQFQIASSSAPIRTQEVKRSETVQNQESDLDVIKSELDKIITRMSGDKQQTTTVPSGQVEGEIAKLISERNTLLNTGVYMSEDFIIQQLDNRIKSLLPLKDSNVY